MTPSDFEVISPVSGATAATGQAVSAPRLETLNGKTICEAYNDMFRGERTFPGIRELLKKRYPDARFVPYDELPYLGVVSIEEGLKELPGALKKKGCDALIAGNGG
ncbi:MAG: hypothetical protein ABID87_03650 [Chloroflexota bacterium]